MKFRRRLSSASLIAGGFALIILLGALLLTLPASNRDGESLPFLSALFTACSACCVTGLVVCDTWTQFSGFGQGVILLLIQLGGLGFMSFAILFSMVLRRRIGLKERMDISEAFASGQTGGVIRLTRRILLGTLLFELTGAVLLCLRFIPLFGWKTGLWYGIFHSVSAFCNAGFDLMGRVEPFSSLTRFVGDPLVNLTIMALIILGGAGFIVWNDVADCRFRWRRYALHTKLVVVFSGGILLVSAALFWVTEAEAAFAGLPPGQRALAALFAAVTPRTAGFNTVNNASLSNAGSILTILLMIVGASPGSTGGGAKVTTVAVMLLATAAYARGRTDVQAYGRRVDSDLVRKAFCSFLIYVCIGLGGAFLVSAAQPLALRDVLLECFSAIGTVGLSTGITPQLGAPARILLILLMYTGRVGSLTLFTAMSLSQNGTRPRCPVERVMIG